MAKPLIIVVKESDEELRQFIRMAKTPTKKKRRLLSLSKY
jgi:hypothetical protein